MFFILGVLENVLRKEVVSKSCSFNFLGIYFLLSCCCVEPDDFFFFFPKNAFSEKYLALILRAVEDGFVYSTLSLLKWVASFMLNSGFFF